MMMATGAVLGSNSEGEAKLVLVEAGSPRALLLVLPGVSHYLLPIVTIMPRPYTLAGVAPMVLGIALATWASRTFRAVGTGYQLHGAASRLATSGPFRVSRNPMYLAMVLWLIGLAVLLGSLVVFLYPVFLFLVANFLLIPIEETEMTRTFGEQYREYMQRVRRWI